MDDIGNQLNRILSDPNSMAQIQNIMGSLGLQGQGSSAPASPPAAASSPPAQQQSASPDLGALLGMLGGAGSQTPSALPAGTEMISTLTRLAPLLGKVKEEDNSTRLLLALKPMLSEERRKKIDEAMRILQLMRLFPILKDSGILSSLLGGLF